MQRAHANLAVTVIGVAALLVVGGVVWFGTGGAAAPPTSAADGILAPAPAVIAVHVAGEVARPGLVEIPPSSRIADAVRAAGGVTPDADLTGTNLAAPVHDGDHIVVPPVGSERVDGASSGIDLNRSAASDLEALPGVGPVIAQRIVDHREEHGPFRTVEDLLDVPGIGEATLARMRDAISAP